MVKRLCLTQMNYMEKVFTCFGMKNTKPVATSLAAHIKLSASMVPQSDEER